MSEVTVEYVGGPVISDGQQLLVLVSVSSGGITEDFMLMLPEYWASLTIPGLVRWGFLVLGVVT